MAMYDSFYLLRFAASISSSCSTLWRSLLLAAPGGGREEIGGVAVERGEMEGCGGISHSGPPPPKLFPLPPRA